METLRNDGKVLWNQTWQRSMKGKLTTSVIMTSLFKISSAFNIMIILLLAKHDFPGWFKFYSKLVHH